MALVTLAAKRLLESKKREDYRDLAPAESREA